MSQLCLRIFQTEKNEIGKIGKVYQSSFSKFGITAIVPIAFNFTHFEIEILSQFPDKGKRKD